jgi:hypothetical protein
MGKQDIIRTSSSYLTEVNRTEPTPRAGRSPAEDQFLLVGVP